MKPGLILTMAGALATSLGVFAQAPITIRSQDMFNEVGQSYKVYANVGQTDVTGLLGPTGGPQTWDFSSGPEDKTYSFEYVDPATTGVGADFPSATFAEKKTDSADGSVAYLFLKQVFGTGRLNYGFYDPAFNPDDPSVPFSTAIIDFPDPINYGDTWSANTTFSTSIIGIQAIINYEATDTVDAYGLILLPDLGFESCLRINELTVYNTQVDLDGTGNFQTISTDYIRNYYWLSPNHGIVAQITSPQQGTPPPDGFTIAAQFVRMFELNHPLGDHPVEPVSSLKITRGKGQVLINWIKPANAANFSVEATDNPGDPSSWVEVQAKSTKNFFLDESVPNNKHRFYRIVSFN